MSTRWGGSRRYRSTPNRHFIQLKPSTSLPEPQGSQKRLEVIKIDTIDIANVKDAAKIEDNGVLGTFNWRSSLNRTELVVPGRPPRWQSPVITRDLNEDGGIYYRDVNSAHYASFPTEPAIRAVLKLQPELDLSKIDVFGCGNTIGSLLSFVKDEDRTFRFGVDLVGTTLFLVRKTNTPGELINDIRGYGHSFAEAYTSWDADVKGSTSHQRIIKYQFAGLTFCVRSESDGYLPDLLDSVTAAVQDNSPISEKKSTDISKLLALNLGLQKPAQNTTVLDIQPGGELIPQQAIFDLKTRNMKVRERTGISADEFLHRLWVNQTPNFILAFHTRGKFEVQEIHIVDVRKKLLDWEKENTIVLKKLGSLIQKLISIAKQSDRKKYEIRRSGDGPLEIWSEVPGWSALPVDLEKHFGQTVIPENESDIAAEDLHEDEQPQSEDEDDWRKF